MLAPRLLSLLAAVALGLLLATILVPHSRALLPALPAPQNPAPLPVLVTIEDLAGEPWPWPRLDLTLLLRAVLPYRPEPVGLLLPLDAPDVFDAVQDDQLARALSSFSTAVLPATALPPLPQTAQFNLPKIPHTGSLSLLREASAFFAPEERLRNASIVAAWKVSPESDGQLRRLPLVFQQAGSVVPSWLLVMYARALGADLRQSELQGRRLVLRDSSSRPLQTIPLDLRGSVPIDWTAPEPVPTKMEIRGVVLAAEQNRIAIRPYYDLSLLQRKPLLVSGTLPVIDLPIHTPLGKKNLTEAVLRVWTTLGQGPRAVLHPPSWILLLTLLAAAGLGLSCGSRWPKCALEAVAFSGIVLAGGWFAARYFGISGALPLSLGCLLATLSAPLFFSWMEASRVR